MVFAPFATSKDTRHARGSDFVASTFAQVRAPFRHRRGRPGGLTRSRLWGTRAIHRAPVVAPRSRGWWVQRYQRATATLVPRDHEGLLARVIASLSPCRGPVHQRVRSDVAGADRRAHQPADGVNLNLGEGLAVRGLLVVGGEKKDEAGACRGSCSTPRATTCRSPSARAAPTRRRPPSRRTALAQSGRRGVDPRTGAGGRGRPRAVEHLRVVHRRQHPPGAGAPRDRLLRDPHPVRPHSSKHRPRGTQLAADHRYTCGPLRVEFRERGFPTGVHPPAGGRHCSNL